MRSQLASVIISKHGIFTSLLVKIMFPFISSDLQVWGS